jgi:hypothetical protein
VVALLAVFAATTFSNYRDNQALSGAVQEVLSLLHEARQDTLASLDASAYGVHFETSAVTYFKGSAYAMGSPDNSAVALDSAVEISDISLAGGGSDVVFERLTGAVSAYGSVTLRSVGNTAKIRTITVLPTGIASQ